MKKTDLRKQAEELIKRKKSPATNAKVDSLRMIYELEVHQIELKMQNEGLIQARAETEAALRQYTDLYDFAPVGYFTLMRDGAIQQVNLSGATLLGAERGKLLTRRLGLFAPLRSRPVLNAFLEKVFAAGGEKQTCEIELLKGKTESFWAQIEAIYDESHETCRAVMVDISKRKQAEEVLRDTERNYRALVEASSEIAYGMSADWSTMLPLDGRELVASSDRALTDWAWLDQNLPRDEHARVRQAIGDAIARKGLFELEHRVVRPDGSTGWTHSRAVPILDENDDLVKWLGTASDITKHKQADDAVRFQATLLNAVGQAVIATDTNGIITYFNRAAESIYGWTATEALGRNILTVTVPQASQEQAAELLNQLTQGKSWEGEFPVQRRDGSIFPALVHDSPVLDHAGKLIGIIGVSSDISERKQAEEILQREETKYRTLVEQLPVVIYVNPIEDIYSTNYVSPQITAFLGYTQKEWLDDPYFWSKALHPEDRQRVLAEVEQIKQSGQPFDKEYRMITQTGTVVWVRDQMQLLRDSDGNPLLWQGLMINITERKQAENQLRKTQAFLSAILEHAPASIYTLSLDQRFTLVNRQWEQDTQIKRADAIGRSQDEIFPSALAGKYREDNLLVANSGKLLAVEEWAETPDGLRCYYTLKFPLRDSDGFVESVVGLSLDITERKQAEEALHNEQTRIQTILETVGDSIFVKDNDHRIIIANHTFYDVFGMDKNAVIGKTLAENVPENERQQFLAVDRQVLDTGVPDLREETLTVGNITRTIITRKTRFVEDSGKRFLVGSVHDITERKLAEEALRENQQRLALATQAGHIGVWDWDVVNDRTIWADNMYDLYGIAKGDFGGAYEAWAKTLHPDDREAIDAQIQATLNGGREFAPEFRIISGDGSIKYIQSASQTTYDASGKAVRMVGVNMDITARKRAEDQLRTSEARLKFSQQVAHVGHWTWDTVSNRVTWSDEMKRIFGLDPEIFDGDLAEVIERAIHPDDRERVNAANNTVITEQNSVSLEYRVIKQDGSIRTIWAEAAEKILDADGKILKLSGIVQDITERKREEEALRASEERLQFVTLATQDAVYDWDMLSGHVFRNEAYQKLFSPDEPVGTDETWWEKQLFPDDRERIMASIGSVFGEKQQFWSGEYRFRRHDGNYAYVIDRGYIMYDVTGKAIRMIGAMTDFSERKQAEEALQESELFAKSTLDALSAQLAILDENGVILAVNRAWRTFAEANSSGSTDLVYEGVNYLSVCETSSGPQSEEAADMAAGIHRVMSGEQAEFSLEYPCHSPTEKRWFNARVTRFAGSGARRIAVAHENITERKQVEKNLRNAETKYRTLVEQIHPIVYMTGRDQHIGVAYVSPQIKILGFTQEEWIADPELWFRQIHPDDQARVLEEIEQNKHSGKPFRSEYRLRTRNGIDRWFLDEVKDVLDGDGNILFRQGFMLDITERKQAEANLQSQNEYLGLLNNMTRVILLSNDFDATMQTLAVDMAKLINADDCYITRWDAENERTIPVVSTAKLGIPFSKTTPPLDERSMDKSVLLAGHVLTANDVFNSPHTNPNIARNYPARSILGVPLIVGTNKLGAAIIAFNTPHDFTTQEIERAEHAGAQIAIALLNFQQSAEIQQSLKESNTLIEIARALGETERTGSNTVLQFIVDSARELIPQAEQAVIHIVDQAENKLVPQATAGLSEEAHDESQIGMQMGVGVAGQVINDGIVINIADVHTDARFLRANDAPAFRSLLVAPVQSGRQQIGTISLQSRQAHAFSKKEEKLLKALGIEAAITIENTRLFETTQQRLKEVDALYKTSQGLATSLDPDELINDTVILLQKNFGYYYVQVYLQDLINGDLILKMGSGEIGNHLLKNGYRLPRGTGIVGHVAETAVPFVTSNINGVVFFERNPLLPDTESEMAVPIKIERDVIGILDIQEKHPHRLTEEDLKLMTAVADQLAAALQKANLYTDLQTALAQEQTMRLQLIQSERLALVGRLLASVSHELNNPMQAIQNALFLLKEEAGLSSQGKQDLDIVLSETERMTVLIERLHSAYRPIRITDFKPIQLNSLIEDVYALIGTHMRHKEIAFEFFPDADLPSIPGISDQIRQVALNLFLNAVEVMQPGGRLAVQTRNLIGQNEVLLSVMDSGPGIDPEFLPKIFDPFITSKHTGTGLGLTITRDIIEQHHGRIQAQNNPEGGAVFNIWLPLDGKG